MYYFLKNGKQYVFQKLYLHSMGSLRKKLFNSANYVATRNNQVSQFLTAKILVKNLDGIFYNNNKIHIHVCYS